MNSQTAVALGLVAVILGIVTLAQSRLANLLAWAVVACGLAVLIFVL